MSGDREKRIARQRARIRELEAARDAFRAQAEASLVVPCACGRPMPSVSSRLRCDACRAEGERDEARATLRAAANRARGIAQAAADDEAALAVLGPLVAERDEARAACAEMRLVVESLREAIADRAGPRMATLRHSEWWGPDQWATIHAPSDAGAPLRAELRALRAVRDAAAEHVRWDWLHLLVDDPNADDVRSDVERLRAALAAAKGGG